MTINRRAPHLAHLHASILSLAILIAHISSNGIEALQAIQQRPRNVLTRFAASAERDDMPSIGVAMTREEGKNGKLLKALDSSARAELRTKIQPVELPCIAHADGPDLPKLRQCLLEDSWDYVAITSPEAARVLASAWDGEQMASKVKVAAVGKATRKTLNDNGIDVAFTPSKAYAKVLVEELPGSAGTTLLYPCSCRAPGTLAEGLTQRGFEVTRLDTYDTVTAEWTDSQRELSQRCDIVCFASPSSIKGWLQNTSSNNQSVLAACIGGTSAQACRELGWDESHIFCPDSPGMEGWVDAIAEAVGKLEAVPTSG